MTSAKQKFAIKLLFWLLPWPISRALPLSLRIYYWGPTGGPPPGFYDYWGVPKWFWEDIPSWEDFLENLPDEAPPWWPPNAPSWEDFLDNLPDEAPPWWPMDPYNPPDPEYFPEPPAGPTNPSNPYTPGPGAGSTPRQPNPEFPYFDNTWWEPLNLPPDAGTWDAVNKEWDSYNTFGVDVVELLPIGGWEVGGRWTYLFVDFTIARMDAIVLYDTDDEKIVQVNDALPKVYNRLDWSNGKDLARLSIYIRPGGPFSVTGIRFV